MNEISNYKEHEVSALKESICNTLSQLSGEEVLKLGGMLCVAGTICFCVFCATGYEAHYKDKQFDIKKTLLPQPA